MSDRQPATAASFPDDFYKTAENALDESGHRPATGPHMRSRLAEDKALRAEVLRAYQLAASTALAEASLFIEGGDLDRLASFVSWTHTAESERNKIKETVGW